ncbi:RIIa domain-containing protein 1 [Varanus komodoensis]|uniref:RIIa domain-containing protein 1 n=1 Tax=Varanus komodoensis TaxID=61221 RepID=UPI001CF78D72|nr:RIIa domain-containing protein 1 [Varanus komodoensis]
MVDVGSGLESLDVGSLHAQQQEKLLEFKINTRIANEKYLRSHKEVQLLLSGFLREVLMQRPENIREFAADYFTNPELPKKIQHQMMEERNKAL